MGGGPGSRSVPVLVLDNLCGLSALEAVPGFESFQILGGLRFVVLRNVQTFAEEEGITAGDVGNGEFVGDQKLMIRNPGIEHPQAGQIPLAIVRSDHGLGFIGLKARERRKMVCGKVSVASL